MTAPLELTPEAHARLHAIVAHVTAGDAVVPEVPPDTAIFTVAADHYEGRADAWRNLARCLVALIGLGGRVSVDPDVGDLGLYGVNDRIAYGLVLDRHSNRFGLHS